jgi:C-terminal peptidase prc
VQPQPKHWVALTLLLASNIGLATLPMYVSALLAQHWALGYAIGAAAALLLNAIWVRRYPAAITAAKLASLFAAAGAICVLLTVHSNMVFTVLEQQEWIFLTLAMAAFISPLLFKELTEAVTSSLFGQLLKQLCSGPALAAAAVAATWVYVPHVMFTDIVTSTALIEEINAKTGIGPSVERMVKIAFDDIYFFKDSPRPLQTGYDTASLVSALRAEPDKWSSVRRGRDSGPDVPENRSNYGIWMERLENQRMAISYVHPGSPAERAGIRRGDRIVRINGRDIRQMRDEEVNNLLNESTSQVALQTYRNNVGVFKYSLENTSYQFVAIPDWKILNHDGVKIAYVMLNGFLRNWKSELKTKLVNIKEQDFDYMVLDLRFNGGGYVNGLLYLAGAIGGEDLDGLLAKKTYANDRYKYTGEERRFPVDSAVALNLRRIAVITSERTCSAAESLVMLLKPYIEVGVIGAQTCGKPYIAQQIQYDDWQLSVLTKNSKNATGEVVSSDGLIPDCYADDDISLALGDVREKSLKAALHWLTKDRQCLVAN